MEYIKINCDETEYWIELCEDKIATRQIMIEEHKHNYFSVSCADMARKHIPNNVRLSCIENCLAEGVVDISELDGDIETIKRQVFDEKWFGYVDCFFHEWQKMKQIYPIGSIFVGKTVCFYPQGTIVKNKDAVAIIAECGESPYLKSLVSGEVIGYDDANLWLILR